MSSTRGVKTVELLEAVIVHTNLVCECSKVELIFIAEEFTLTAGDFPAPEYFTSNPRLSGDRISNLVIVTFGTRLTISVVVLNLEFVGALSRSKP